MAYLNRKRKAIGMMIGGQHRWNYKTLSSSSKRTGPKTIIFKSRQSKSRAGKQYSKGFPKGGKLHWKIKGTEVVKKVGDLYQHKLYATKTQQRFALSKDKMLK